VLQCPRPDVRAVYLKGVSNCIEKSSMFGPPGFTSSSHRVEDREELMRAGDQRELWWLVAFAEALVEATDDRVVACPYYCGHV
jgi:hypothetical protein